MLTYLTVFDSTSVPAALSYDACSNILVFELAVCGQLVDRCSVCCQATTLAHHFCSVNVREASTVELSLLSLALFPIKQSRMTHKTAMLADVHA